MTTGETQGDYREGWANLRRALVRARHEALRPPPKRTLAEWTTENFKLSPESSADTGDFNPWGFQVGMLEAVTNPKVQRVTVMKSARVGYTKVVNAAVGFHIHQDPSPILVVQPRVEDAEDYSKTEISPMLRDSPVLAEIVGEVKGKDPNNTIRRKVFRNGASLSLLGANSPNEFRRVTARILAFDEVDAYPTSTSEGDPIDLGTQRTTSFWNRKILMGSTPTVKDESRIEKAWQASDQRLYFVPCPHCGEEQVLEFGSDKPHGLRWPKDDEGRPLPDEAYYLCVNGCEIGENHKPWMVENGRWIPQKPENAGHAGFHISALYSLFWNARWSVIAQEFLERKDDPPRLQTFVNTTLGETWEPPADHDIDESNLMARREVYPAEVPDGVAILAMGVDHQDDRLEAEVVGWGWDEESWSIEHFVLMGNPGERDVWDRLDEVRLRTWQCADGRQLKIDSVCVDTGGHHTQAAYQYCVARMNQNVWPIKGQAQKNGRRNPVFPKKPSRNTKGRVPVYIVDVNTAKDTVFPRLAKSQIGPGYCHFPAHYEREYFDQLTAEKPVSERVDGRMVRKWKVRPGQRNEAFDLRVYAYAALAALQTFGFKLNEHAAKVGATRPEERGAITWAQTGSTEVPPRAETPALPEGVATTKPTRAKKRQGRRRRARMSMG